MTPKAPGLAPYQCVNCGKIFYNQVDLREHERQCKPVKPAERK